MSGRASPIHWVSCGRRTFSEFTFQEAIFIGAL
jgi:hypothetical protein